MRIKSGKTALSWTVSILLFSILRVSDAAASDGTPVIIRVTCWNSSDLATIEVPINEARSVEPSQENPNDLVLFDKDRNRIAPILFSNHDQVLQAKSILDQRDVKLIIPYKAANPRAFAKCDEVKIKSTLIDQQNLAPYRFHGEYVRFRSTAHPDLEIKAEDFSSSRDVAHFVQNTEARSSVADVARVIDGMSEIANAPSFASQRMAAEYKDKATMPVSHDSGFLVEIHNPSFGIF